MQESFTASPTWPQTLFGLLASFVTGATIVKLINVWLNRRKPAAEVHLTEATTTEIKVRAGSAAGDAIIKMMDRLDGAQATIDRLREQRDHWERKATDLMLDLEDSRNANGEKEIRLRLHEYQTKRLKGLLDAHAISYSEIDRPRLADAQDS